jgi:hypothetical protein
MWLRSVYGEACFLSKWTALGFVYLLLQFAPATQRAKTDDSKAALKAARELHAAIVHLLSSGDAALDSKVPEILQSKFPSQTVETTPSKGPSASVHSGSDHHVLTVREVLAQTEDAMASSGKVHLKLRASPDSCAIVYVPVIGGSPLNAGTTETEVDVQPKYYQFTCSCHDKNLKQAIDATSDRTISFECNP